MRTSVPNLCLLGYKMAKMPYFCAQVTVIMATKDQPSSTNEHSKDYRLAHKH